MDFILKFCLCPALVWLWYPGATETIAEAQKCRVYFCPLFLTQLNLIMRIFVYISSFPPLQQRELGGRKGPLLKGHAFVPGVLVEDL